MWIWRNSGRSSTGSRSWVSINRGPAWVVWKRRRQKKRCVILSGARSAKSKNLRIWSTFAVKLVPGSFDSLSLAQDDSNLCGLRFCTAAGYQDQEVLFLESDSDFQKNFENFYDFLTKTPCKSRKTVVYYHCNKVVSMQREGRAPLFLVDMPKERCVEYESYRSGCILCQAHCGSARL